MEARKISLPQGGSSEFMEDLPVSPATAVPIYVHGYAVTVDPSRTAASALLGVMPDDASKPPMLLRAGETMRVPGGFQRLFLFNATGWLSARCDATSKAHQRIGLLISKRADLADMHLQALTAPKVPQAASVVWRGYVEPVGAPSEAGDSGNLGWVNPSPIVPTPGVSRVRVSAIPAPLLPGGQQAQPPVDFLASIRPYSLATRSRDNNLFSPTNGRAPENPWDDPMSSAFLNWGIWLPHGASDMTATVDDCVFDIDLVDNLALGFRLVSVAGTNVTGIYLVIEAF